MSRDLGGTGPRYGSPSKGRPSILAAGSSRPAFCRTPHSIPGARERRSMLKHLRSTWLAGAGAALLILSMTGLAGAATLVDDTTPATLSTFEDLNGNGIDDDCETGVTEDAAAVTAAMAAVDVDADGVISVTEAAHSSWVGGTNCNDGGYVSTVAAAAADAC